MLGVSIDPVCCLCAGPAGGGDDAQCDGARQVGVFPELSPGAQLHAHARAPHRADRPRQGEQVLLKQLTHDHTGIRAFVVFTNIYTPDWVAA